MSNALALRAAYKNTDEIVYGLTDTHFTDEEWESLVAGSSKSYINHLSKAREHFLKLPLSDLIKQITPNNTSLNRYIYLHALYGRCVLPLRIASSVNFQERAYPVKPRQWFECQEKFNYCFNSVFGKVLWRDKVEDKNFRNKFYKHCQRELITLWMAGVPYDLITHEILKSYWEELEVRAKPIAVLWKVLFHGKHPGVTELYTEQGKNTLPETSAMLWFNSINYTSEPIAEDARKFIFDHLLNSVGKNYVHHFQVAKQFRSLSLRKIAITTWYAYSQDLLAIIHGCKNLGIKHIDDIIDNPRVLLEWMRTRWSGSALLNMLTILRKWLDFELQTRGTGLREGDIIPTFEGVSPTRYPKPLFLKAASRLIKCLWDAYHASMDCKDSYTFFYVRACLLILVTASRPHEVLILPHECLIPGINKHGKEIWGIRFPKTKRGRNVLKPAFREAIEIVNSIKKYACPKPIFLTDTDRKGGDNKCLPRLFANKWGDDIVTTASVSNFFEAFQEKHKIVQPNGKTFTLHDLRRLCAIALRLSGYTTSQIQTMLAQVTPGMEQLYLGGKPDIIRQLASLAEQGIHRGLYESIGISPAVTIQSLLETSSQFKIKAFGISDDSNKAEVIVDMGDTNDLPEGWTPLLSDEPDQYIFDEDSLGEGNEDVKLFSELIGEVQKLDPIKWLNVNENSILVDNSNVIYGEIKVREESFDTELFHELVWKSSIHCYGCDWYRPAPQMVFEHVLDVFQYHLLTILGEKGLKTIRKQRLHADVSYDIEEIRSEINASKITFVNWYGISQEGVDKLFNHLQIKAREYVKENSTAFPLIQDKKMANFVRAALRSIVISGI